MTGTRQIARNRSRSAHAPDQYFGYSIQAVRMLARLLDADFGDTITLEVFEDVGLEAADGERLAEQVTSSLSRNPVSDGADKLWKTFDSWARAVERGELDPQNTRFVLYVAQAHSGSVAEGFSAAESDGDAAAALANAREKLLPRSIASTHLRSALATEDALLVPIVKRFQLVRGSGNPLDDVRSILRKHPMRLAVIDHVMERLLGWVHRRTIEQLAQGSPATVRYDEFRPVYESTVRKYDRLGPLPSLVPRPDEPEIIASVADSTLIHQLELIQGNDEEKLQAATDFLWASAQRTKWSEVGEVDPSSFDEFEETLQRIWQMDRGKTSIQYKANSEEERGKILYYGCMGCHCTLAGREVPSHFVPGCFHALADVETVGWHPRFKELLHTREVSHKEGPED